MGYITKIGQFFLANYKTVIILLIFIKLISLPFTSFPFDFASYVFQVRQYFDYDIDILFFWNKGVGLLSILYLQYGAYTALLDIFGIQKDNLYLLHVFYKLPFLMLDLLTGLAIYKLVLMNTNRIDLAKTMSVLWLANPLVFWMTEVQGQYAVIVSFSLVISFLMLKGCKLFTSAGFLALASSVYYFPVILLPFQLAYVLKNYGTSKSIRYLLGFSLVLILSFGPFLINREYTSSLINSVLHHSAPNAPITSKEVFIPDYSLFKVPYFITTGKMPNNVSSPEYFKYVGKSSLLAIIVVIIFILYRLSKLLTRGNYKFSYSFDELIQDSLITITIFILLIGKFQTHYFLWLLPLLLISRWGHYSIASRLFLLLASFIPLFTTLAKMDLGIFFLDVLERGYVNFHIEVGVIAATFMAAILMLSVLALIPNLLLFELKLKKLKTQPLYANTIVFMSYAVFYIIFLSFLVTGVTKVVSNNAQQRTELVSAGRIYLFPFIQSNNKTSDRTIKYDEGNSYVNSIERYENTMVQRRYLNNTPFYLYPLSNDRATASITNLPKGIAETKGIKLMLDPSGKAQINSGPEIKNHIEIAGNNLYEFKSDIIGTAKMTGNLEISIRYRNQANELIRGNNKLLANGNVKNGITKHVEYIRTPNAATTAEIIYTLNAGTGARPTVIYIDNISLRRINIKHINSTEFISKEDPQKLIHGILNNNEATQHFILRTYIEAPDKLGTIDKFEINGCKPSKIKILNETEMEIIHTAKCFSEGTLLLDAAYTDFLTAPDVSIALSQVPVKSLYLDNKRNTIYGLAIFSTVFSSTIIVLIIRYIRRLP